MSLYDTAARASDSYLIITIFAKHSIKDVIPVETIESLLIRHSVGFIDRQYLSDRVLRVIHQYRQGTPSPSVLRHDPEVLNFEATHEVELVLHIHSDLNELYGHLPLRLAVFDMDSTLIDQEVIDELARSIGAGEEVARITALAMAGDLDFGASLKNRVALLKNVRSEVWEELRKTITFSEGARLLCYALKKHGVLTAVVSGGFIEMAEWAKKELGLDYAFANHLITLPPSENFPFSVLAGELDSTYPLIDASAKNDVLKRLAQDRDVPSSQILCVGDGANDLLMLAEAAAGGGIGIAFKAKPKVQLMAPQRLNSSTMTDLLYLLGWNEAEIEALKLAS